MSTRRLYLVRHGLPDYSTCKPGDEPPGPPLSELGRVQIRQVIPLLAKCKLDALYCSPLARTCQSADVVGRALGMKPQVRSDLKEWHRTERLYEVNERSTRWLCDWLRGGDMCAVAFGHASPLLSIIRSALYLPHYPWWHANSPRRLVLDTCDRLEVSMASLFELEFTTEQVTARCLHHPEPRIVHKFRGRSPIRNFPRPVQTTEQMQCTRPNYNALIGYQIGDGPRRKKRSPR